MDQRVTVSAPDEVLSRRARIATHTVWDHLVRPVERDAGRVPWSTAGLSVEWLTSALAGDVPGAEVVDFALSDRSDGTSSRERVRVRYNDAGIAAGLPEWLHAKFTPNLATRLTSSGLAASETDFYLNFRPELDIESPRAYWGGVDRASGRSLLLLEDIVKSKSAVFGSPTLPIDRSHAEQIVDTLATLHGTFYGDPRLTAPERGIRPLEDIYGAKMIELIRDVHQEAILQVADRLPSGVVDGRARILELASASLDDHRTSPRTLVHSDVHLGNWYLIDDRAHVGMIDWQAASAGFWARDLGYALSSALSIEDRRAWEEDLIERYVAALNERAHTDISFDEAFDAYRRQIPAAILLWTSTLVHLPWVPDMQPEHISREMIARMGTAIDDHGSLSRMRS
jgi:aminoglycoside phosphotransferase (APT) family kinase protein